jgi:putative transcriptional regulator
MRRLLAWTLVFVIGSVPARPGRTAPTPGGNDEAVPTLAGQLLVAEPELGDPNFAQTVVLVLHHGRDGALGLVVNRPYGMAPTAELLRRLGQPAEGVKGETQLFYGGPVEPEVGMVVHSPDYQRPTTRRINDGLAVTSDPAILADLARGRGPKQAIPVLGYAGWGPGQLESELVEGAWFAIPADPALIFAPGHEGMWRQALARKGVDL